MVSVRIVSVRALFSVAECSLSRQLYLVSAFNATGSLRNLLNFMR